MQGVVGKPPMLAFTIYYGTREGDGMRAAFRVWQMRYTPANGSWSTMDALSIRITRIWSCMMAPEATSSGGARRTGKDGGSRNEPIGGLGVL